MAGVIGDAPDRGGVLGLLSKEAVRASAGAGLVGIIPNMGRMSLTFSKIFASREFDNVTQVIQLGFSTSFE